MQLRTGASLPRSSRVEPVAAVARVARVARVAGGACVARGAFPLLVAAALASPRAASAAGVEASQRVTLFQEPSSAKHTAGITVFHPQTDVSATLGSAVGLAAGYAVDVVSGATPAVFRCGSQSSCVDAITTATRFSDTRQEVKGAITYTRPVADVTVGYSYGWENDYKSNALSVATKSDVLDHAFTVSLSYTHNLDRVCDQNNASAAGQPLDRVALATSANCFKGTPDVTTHRLSVDSVEPSLTWAVTPRLLLQGGGTLQILDGFQANPYRSVALGSAGRTPQESLPDFRQRFALFGHGAYAFPGARAAVHVSARAYRDTWAVEAVSAELLINQYLARFLLLSARGRLHAQRGASFYRDALGYETLGPTGK